MNFQRLHEVRTKYWNSLSGKTMNHGDILIAFEVVHMLPVKPISIKMDFSAVWAEEVENAKDHIRDIYEEIIGFGPHNVLELTRRLYEFKCLGSRNTISPFYWKLFSVAKELIATPEYMDEGEALEAFNYAEMTINIKRASIAGYSGASGTSDIEAIYDDCLTELDKIMSVASKDKTSTTMNRQFSYAKNVISAYIDLITLSNTFDFARYDTRLVETYLVCAFEAVLVEQYNKEALIKAVQELVE